MVDAGAMVAGTVNAAIGGLGLEVGVGLGISVGVGPGMTVATGVLVGNDVGVGL